MYTETMFSKFELPEHARQSCGSIIGILKLQLALQETVKEQISELMYPIIGRIFNVLIGRIIEEPFKRIFMDYFHVAIPSAITWTQNGAMFGTTAFVGIPKTRLQDYYNLDPKELVQKMNSYFGSSNDSQNDGLAKITHIESEVDCTIYRFIFKLIQPNNLKESGE